MKNSTFQRTLSGVLAFAVGLWAFTSVAFAQVPSYSPPPFQPSTFGAAVSFAAPQTGAGDLLCITGSATRLIKVKRVTVSGTNTTAQSNVINLVKRTAANTGGTATNPAGALFDSSQVVTTATAVLSAYTAVPTSGAGVTIASRLIAFATAATATANVNTWTFTPTDLYNEVRLRGAAQQLCVNITGAFTTAGPALTVELIWTEQ